MAICWDINQEPLYQGKCLRLSSFQKKIVDETDSAASCQKHAKAGLVFWGVRVVLSTVGWLFHFEKNLYAREAVK